MSRSTVAIVTPALADANNGNWQTARRWAGMLEAHFRVELMREWAGGAHDVMVALHARRSAASIAAWREQRSIQPLVVALTGTDLYRDIGSDASAKRSLELADRLIVLNELGARSVPPVHRRKVVVCLQSCRRHGTKRKTARHLRALMVGHLREEKSPRTYFAAARLLAARQDIWLDHIGGALDPALGREAAELVQSNRRYRWLGALPHAATRERIGRAHVLVHASRMEGGAHVVIEALQSGTPVLASRIDGNLGLLGAGWPATFAWDDAEALAAGLVRLRDDAAMLAALCTRAHQRAALFEPERERATLLALLRSLT